MPGPPPGAAVAEEDDDARCGEWHEVHVTTLGSDLENAWGVTGCAKGWDSTGSSNNAEPGRGATMPRRTAPSRDACVP